MINNLEDFVNKFNIYFSESIPFYFMIDYELNKPVILKLDNITDDILIKTNLIDNSKNENKFNSSKIIEMETFPVEKSIFNASFDNVLRNMHYGNSYLLNLTFPSKIKINLSLEDIFYNSNARFKIKYKNNFVVFSPEIFVEIEDGKIYSYPMKGTINADIDDAEKKLINDKKELAEHYTIVDLIRNDLSIIAENIEVEKFRYIEKIKTNNVNLLQTSSKISGILRDDFESNAGSMFLKLLPAGSISGAPKEKTIEIISESELDERGYYTGVFGVYDGKKLESAVMIRYIENTENGMQFRSGGGITFLSDKDSEYKEMVDKIYVPTN